MFWDAAEENGEGRYRVSLWGCGKGGSPTWVLLLEESRGVGIDILDETIVLVLCLVKFLRREEEMLGFFKGLRPRFSCKVRSHGGITEFDLQAVQVYKR